ncbi:MAG: ADP-ribosyltransferase [Bdellovibrionia bacterium]
MKYIKMVSTYLSLVAGLSCVILPAQAKANPIRGVLACTAIKLGKKDFSTYAGLFQKKLLDTQAVGQQVSHSFLTDIWGQCKVAQGSESQPSEESRSCLTPEERAALSSYTSYGFFSLNSNLRKNINSEEVKVFKNLLLSAMSKLPVYEGVVFRGCHLPEKLLREHEVGSTITYPAFTSTSFKYNLQVFRGCSHQFLIKAKTGAMVCKYSRNQGESEVLFRPNTKFKILEKERLPQFDTVLYGDAYQIHMEEVTEKEEMTEENASSDLVKDNCQDHDAEE